jgi:hypothetical protein
MISIYLIDPLLVKLISLIAQKDVYRDVLFLKEGSRLWEINKVKKIEGSILAKKNLINKIKQ